MASNLETILTNLNANYESITNLVDDLYYFDDYDETEEKKDTTPSGIQDGGDDMYDGANYLSTNRLTSYEDGKEANIDDLIFNDEFALVGAIAYTHTTVSEEPEENTYTNPPMDGEIVEGTTQFGSGSTYFTNMYPGMFVLCATNIDINEFSIMGNIGADGTGEVEVGTYSYNGYHAYYKSVYNSGDPSINHIIIVPNEVTRVYDDSVRYDDHAIQGDIGDELYYLIIARHEEAEEPTSLGSSAFESIVNYFIDNIIASTEQAPQTVYPTYTFQVVTNNDITITDSPAPYQEKNIYEYLKKQATVWIKQMDRSFKHGDTFTVHGEKARYIKRVYIDDDRTGRPILKIVE